FVVDAGDTELAELVERMPASASSDYGTPFYDIFKRYNNDFYKIDPLLFSPGEVWLMSATSGRTFHAGALNPEVLRASLFEAPCGLPAPGSPHERLDIVRALRMAHRRAPAGPCGTRPRRRRGAVRGVGGAIGFPGTR